MSETVGMKNRLMISRGKKCLVHPFIRQEFWKCIGCILSEVTYGWKRHNRWSETPKTFCNKIPTKLQRDVSGNTDLKNYVVIYTALITVMLVIRLFYITQLCSFLGCFFEYLPLLYL